MMDELELKLRLNQLKNDWLSNPAFVEEVMRRVEQLPEPLYKRVDHRKDRRRWVSVAIVLAGCAALLLWMTHPFDRSLSAQVRYALKNVNSVHTTLSLKTDNGQFRTVRETWFARGQGFAVIGDEQVRIDDGHFFWEFAPGSDMVNRSKSRSTDELLDQAVNVREELQQTCVRFPEGDRQVNDVRQECYRVTFHGVGKPQGFDPDAKRILVFLTSDFLVRSVEHQERVNDDWQTRLTQSCEYDVAVDPSIFKPKLAPNVKVIDSDRAFEQLVDIKTAVYVEERDGLIFAIHKLRRFENGGLFLMTSVRGTDATLKKFPNKRRMMQPGLYVEDGPGMNLKGSPQGSRCFSISLAFANHHGIDVKWWIQVPRGVKPTWFVDEAGRSKIPVGMTPWGSYADQHKDLNGVIQHLNWDLALEVPEVTPIPTVSQIAAETQSDVALLKSVFSKHLDLGIDDVNGVPTAKYAQADRVTPQQFGESVQHHIDWWEGFDIDFQMKSGGKLGFANGKRFVAERGAFLQYYRVVNDATLEKLGAQTDLTFIDVTGTRITDDGLRFLKGLSSLHELSLAETEITDAGLEHLKGIATLKKLNISSTRTTEAGIQKLKVALPELEVEFGPN